MEILEISGCNQSDREMDLIFIHGLNGDGRSTWQADDKPANFWPDWLADEFPDIGVWSLDYDVSASAWKGHTMPLYDRARNCLDRFDLADLGHRPIGFVCHSLGGLLVKQMLRLAKEFGNDNWQRIAEQTQFIVFLSTPHSGANMANWIKYLSIILRSSVSIQELEAHNPKLLELNTWYCNNVGAIKNYVYCETRPTNKILVVNETSANPGIPGVIPIPLDDDHITVCKPVNQTASVYLRVKRLISETLQASNNNNTKTKSTEVDTPPNQNIEKKTAYSSGKIKIVFSNRLSSDWRQLADLLEIKTSLQATWTQGHEAREIWEWLESRNRLAELTDKLQEIDRSDLAIAITQDPQ